ncbi:alpha/beta hydrolase [Nocardia spumae]|uniref:alpha/beta hydrolase n=1 Tax=Nocardia spumae TaxID=2887190 RepID=UPI001D132FA1|nr:alpha/beta fold hydrolase [Nocardia spumae]
MRFFQGVSGAVHYRVWTAERPHSIVVLLHGLGQQSADYHRFSRALNRAGTTVFGIDQIGHGLSEGDEGALAPIEDLAANALALIELSHAANPRLPLTLLGHSLGAATAVVAMSSHVETTAHITSIVLLGTPEQIPAQGYSPPHGPTLILHGGDDRRAPIAAIRAWAADGQSCRLVEVADAGHDLLHEPVHRRITNDIIDFLRVDRTPRPARTHTGRRGAALPVARRVAVRGGRSPSSAVLSSLAYPLSRNPPAGG